MKMIDKFVEKFEEFAGHEGLENLTDEAKVALFGVYLDVLRPSPQPAATAPAASKPSGSSNSRIRKPNRPATAKQKGFIEKLIRQGKLDDDIDADQLTVGEASTLIDQGINSKPKPAPEPEPEPEGEYTGSYSHSSGGATSTKAFWE
jgi:hypothetical protein